ncbi:hypothetical protein H6P81_015484 [Aristolochia fimbriata]|uniref:Protein NRT1/ PTR FAMILY 5.10-like n=1 Tax=Aristolochia fimbriata TaxID=158543 RepID=A0AAV7E7I4_ARIFI|nr:hypothetical protein H6P81_015484 [Aristolochia fimbriata]
MLTLSAALTFLWPPPCVGQTICPSPSPFQMFFFFASLYLVALAQGGHKPCVQAFGADQFDVQDPAERKSKSSFFNWWYFGICSGTMVSSAIVSYIQDNVSWGLGFGIPCSVMMAGFVVFVAGTRTYRYISLQEKNPFLGLAQVFVAAARQSLEKDIGPTGGNAGEVQLRGSNNRFKFLDRVRVIPSEGTEYCSEKISWRVCTPSQVKDAKTVHYSSSLYGPHV